MIGQTRATMTTANEQGGRAVQYAPSPVATRQAQQFAPVDQVTMSITPSSVRSQTTADSWGDPQGGSQWSGMANNPQPVLMQSAPACLDTNTALAMMQCIANPTADCAAMLDPNYLGLPLCAGSTPPPVPECKDDALAEGISYCEAYGFSGANQEMNALCWLASKNPSWYAQVKALPACAGSNTEAEEKKKKTLMIGGILLLLIAGAGTAYYFSRKKKKG